MKRIGYPAHHLTSLLMLVITTRALATETCRPLIEISGAS